MRVCIHRGSKQIGGSCVELEASGQRLVLDLGLPLDAESNDRQHLPVIDGLDGTDPSLLGILISHPHLDHYGLLAHVSQNVKVGLGPAARRMLKAASDFVPGDWPIPVPGWDYESGQTFEVGPFRATPHLVDHSAYDAYALLIEADGKRLFYSGDFRGHGRKAALFNKMIAVAPSNIDALLLEGSSLGRIGNDDAFPSESDVEAQLAQVFAETNGLALVHTSAQNIDRIVSIIRAARKTGRRMVIDLYAASILEATGNTNIPQSDWKDVVLFVPEAQRRHIKKNSLFDLLSRHSTNRIFGSDLKTAPSKFAMLFRPLHRFDLERAECLIDARYIYSQWEGYWDSGTYDILRTWLDAQRIPRISLHTSGHASPKDLKTFVTAVAPKRVVPIHTFKPELYPQLFDNVEPHADGEWWDL
jgi:ribonuclease J